MSSRDVVVVGGGFAGLSAGVRLARAGARVTVLEARSRLGGRATAFHDRESGEFVDNGQHVLLGCYRETFAFLRDIGAQEHVRMEPRLAATMIDRQGVQSTLDCPDLPAPLHLLAGVFEWSALRWRDRWSALRMAGPLRLARRQLTGDHRLLAASPGETVDNWLIRNGQSERLREMLWEPLALAALNQPSSVAAAPPFARVLAEMFGQETRAAAIVLPRRPLHALYAEPARAEIERRGGMVRTGAPATVRLEEGRVADVSSGTEKWQPQVTIVAAPWFALADTFTGDLSPIDMVLRAARGTSPSPIVTVNLWFDGPVMDRSFLGLPGRTFQWVFDKRSILEDASSHLSLVSSGAAEVLARTNEEIIALAHAELTSAILQARTARLVRGSVIREPRATFSLAPGQPARPGTATAVANLFLAGDWIDTGLPATIEGAVRSGHAAASRAGAMLGLNP